MGPVNWLAVILAAIVAAGLALLWYGPLLGRAKLEEVGPGRLAGRRSPARTIAITGGSLLLSAAMMGQVNSVGICILDGPVWGCGGIPKRQRPAVARRPSCFARVRRQ